MREGGVEAKVEPKLRVYDEPLLAAVYENEETESEYELERRYVPAQPLSLDELEKLSGGEKREITQAYIEALDGEGTPVSFRLRTTFQEGKEGTLFRIARKFKIEHSRAKVERQLKIPPHDPDADDFEYLWEAHTRPSEVISKTRYYISHTLPNGHECEIHYDVHHGRFKEFARIEVEFKSLTADEDHQYVLEHGAAALPEWIGEDVSDDKKYGGKFLAKNGPPPEALEAQKLI